MAACSHSLCSAHTSHAAHLQNETFRFLRFENARSVYLYILRLSLEQNSKLYLSLHWSKFGACAPCIATPVALEPLTQCHGQHSGPEIKSGHFRTMQWERSVQERIVRKEPSYSPPTPTPHADPSSVALWLELGAAECTGDCICAWPFAF